MFDKYATRVATFTRPSDTTPYAIGDAVSDDTTTATAATFTLPGMGTGGIIQSVTLHKTDPDAVGADFDVYFFTTQPGGTTYEDNAATAITDAVFQTCVGFASLTAAADGRSLALSDIYCKTNLNLPYECATGSSSLYFVIIARGAYTPGNAEVFTLRVGAVVQA